MRPESLQRKSKGHLGFTMFEEYFRGENGDIYSAPIDSIVDVYGYRDGYAFKYTKDQWDKFYENMTKFIKNPHN